VSRFTKKEDVDIYEMKLHDYVEIEEGPLTYIIHRVHGGWIYIFMTLEGMKLVLQYLYLKQKGIYHE
jgi:hypothetical protein